MPNVLDKETILDWLQEVKDPEIPTVSLVDLGVITEVRIEPEGGVFVEMVPTFSGCPAVEFMRMTAEACLRDHGLESVEVRINPNKMWSSNYVSDRGRKQLLEFGLSPPPRFTGEADEQVLENAICPNCGSTDTEMKTPFGPTLCRAIHHCNNCHETFEQFKPM